MTPNMDVCTSCGGKGYRATSEGPRFYGEASTYSEETCYRCNGTGRKVSITTNHGESNGNPA
jgi:DnaJ-class molecular chaperone